MTSNANMRLSVDFPYAGLTPYIRSRPNQASQDLQIGYRISLTYLIPASRALLFRQRLTEFVFETLFTEAVSFIHLVLCIR